MITITIHEPTHREACINFGAGTAEDAAAYDSSSSGFFLQLHDKLKAEGADLRLTTETRFGCSYSVSADSPDEEQRGHALMEKHGDFWAWYN